MDAPYKVEARGNGCPTCQHGDEFDIIGPGGSAQSQSWSDAEEVEYICELLNEAYAAGKTAFAQQILDLAKGEQHAKEQAVTIEERKPFSVATPDESIPF